MSRSLKYDIPGTDWRRSPLEIAAEGFEGLFDLGTRAPSARVLEIGFGRGEFLLEMSAKRPDAIFLGVEVSFKRVLKMARKAARAGLKNIRLMEARGEVVVGELIDAGCLNEIWINFSDPWPKDRHARRRVIQPEFVAHAAHCLAAGGTLHVATDDIPYADQIRQVLADEPMLENAFAPSEFLSEVPDRIQTGYEIDWRKEGRPIHFFAYRRGSETQRGK